MFAIFSGQHTFLNPMDGSSGIKRPLYKFSSFVVFVSKKVGLTLRWIINMPCFHIPNYEWICINNHAEKIAQYDDL